MSSTLNVVVESRMMEDPANDFNDAEFSFSSTGVRRNAKNMQTARKQECADVKTLNEEEYGCLTSFFQDIKMLYPIFINQILLSLSITLPLPCVRRGLLQYMSQTTSKIEENTTGGIMKDKTDYGERMEAVKIDEEYFSSSNLGIEA
eukprot:CAMPEP_0185259348 /NCGR_PEP_ID=MMETSP1359-20130426/8135_1 /TAXON_ID=552665 /ORGANISM="Bigelowiella longifila, Strain CCMP242" /LENGTH=146 /DNA_ID=CAMNT_0027845215 /DNA_START=143 /DNA_END=583 /DNA_ORIENTATION=-